MLAYESFENLADQQFGAWIVLKSYIRRSSPGDCSRIYWHCKCRCGENRYVDARKLKAGLSRSCGCEAWRHRVYPVPGARFGSWIVQGPRKCRVTSAANVWLYLCRCDCGRLQWVRKPKLIFGESRSCGCRTWIHAKR